MPNCYSTEKVPEVAEFDLQGDLAERLIDDSDVCHQAVGASPGSQTSPDCPASRVSVQCVPFYSALAAIGNPKVDYFSLDVDGPDLQILKTIPWDKVRTRDLKILEYVKFRFSTRICVY